MADEADQKEVWTARFLDYLGLGCILTGIDNLVKGGISLGPFVLVAFGGALLYVGMNWLQFKPKVSPRLDATIERVSLDARWWIGILFVFIIATVAPSIPLSSRGIWFDRLITGGIAIGAIGFLKVVGWLQQLLVWIVRRRSFRTQSARGYLDYLVEQQEAQSALLGIMKTLSQIQQSLDSKIKTHTAEFLKARDSGGRLAAPAHLRRIAARAASDIATGAARLDNQFPRFQANLDAYLSSQLALLKYTQRLPAMDDNMKAQIQAFRIVLEQGFRSTVSSNCQQWTGYKEIMVKLKGISQDMNIALDQNIQVADRMIGMFSDAEQRCSELITVADEILMHGPAVTRSAG